MTIYLPENIISFRQVFDEFCDHIIQSETDKVFYTRFFQLINRLHKHPLLEAYIVELENELKKQQQEFSIAALEAVEDYWGRLWKYHRHNLKYRKELVKIKRLITSPNEFSYSPLYIRILKKLMEFHINSRFCSSILYEVPILFRKALSDLHFASLQLNHIYPSRKGYFTKRKTKRYKMNKKDKRRILHKKIFNPETKEHHVLFKRFVERLPDALFSPKTIEFEQKFFPSGQNNFEKRQYMQIIAEDSPVFCWGKILFLKQCSLMKEPFLARKSFVGPWALIRDKAWQYAFERGEIEVLLGAKISFGQKQTLDPNSSMDGFLLCEHQIHRKDYEKYLYSLRNHIQVQLFKLENMQPKVESDPKLVLSGTLKEAFVINLASKYWKAHPLAKLDEVFEDYCLNCPKGKLLLSRYRWEQIVRERKLDPRPKDAKKRGPGKKTLQN